MTNVIDKRFTQKDGAITNRRKFIDRYKQTFKEAVRDSVNKGSIKDFTFKGKKVSIKTKGDPLDIPNFEMDRENGIYEGVSVGNKKYQKGDRVKKPPQGGSGGKQGSAEGGQEDSFEFILTEKEFADLFFEDLELPDLIKKQFTGDVYEIQRAGFSNTGGPSSLSIKQTIIRAFMRRFALKKIQDKKDDKLIIEDDKIIVKPKKKISFLEDIDLKYNHRDKVILPSSRAVMFCLMDVSGSMGEEEKDIAKRFFILLNMFLKRNYDIVDVVFVRHAEWAEECTEEVFFHGRESGGTIISTGYEKIIEIVKKRYNPEVWNIYMSQASDGDNYEHDNDKVVTLLTKHLLPICQYYAYVEITGAWAAMRGQMSEIFQLLEKIGKAHKNLAVKNITSYKEIFDVFKSLFNKGKK